MEEGGEALQVLYFFPFLYDTRSLSAANVEILDAWSMNGMLGFWPTLFFFARSSKHNLVLKLYIVCEVNVDTVLEFNIGYLIQNRYWSIANM